LWTLGGYELPAHIASTAETPEEPQSQTQLHLDRFLLIVVLAMTGAYMLPTLLVEEKEKHTLQALLVSPASPGDIVISKALTGSF
jgi:ABC-type Na+ efflux pump permease subunit